MLAVARTLAANPSVVLLDEPSEGIAPLIVAKMREAVFAMKARGVATLVSEQNVRFAAAIADRAVLIEQGRVVGEATRAELLTPSESVQRVLALREHCTYNPSMIITSLLDTDLYKFTMMQVVLHHFPGASVEYRFNCRNPGIDLVPHIERDQR